MKSSSDLLKVTSNFWAKVDIGPKDKCWPWLAGKFWDGYGHIWFQGKHHKAHRVSFFLTYGYWPIVCRHSCDHPECCNPNHLNDGSQAENVRDMCERGRHGSAKISLREVFEIRSLSLPHIVIAKLYGVGRTEISRIKGGSRWKS